MGDSREQMLYKLGLSFIPGIGAVHAKTLVSYLGGIEQVFKAKKRELKKIPGIGESRARDICGSSALHKAEKELAKLEKQKCRMLFYLDKEYPERLKSFVSSPLLLYVKGNIKLDALRTVGIVGTRSPSFSGRNNCQVIVDDLRTYDCTIISGLAYGIDAEAHSRCIQIGLPTIAVMGSGLDWIYPSLHKKMAREIMKNGGLISEFPFGTKPDRENFPKRNRIIAALSDALVVVESADKGGSIITAEYANAFSRDVFAVPGRLEDKMSVGCNRLIKTHKAHLFQSVQDIAYVCRWDTRPVQRSLAFMADLSPDEKVIVDIIRKNSPAGLDLILGLSESTLPEISSMLLNLEIRGLVKSKPGKKYILA